MAHWVVEERRGYYALVDEQTGWGMVHTRTRARAQALADKLNQEQIDLTAEHAPAGHTIELPEEAATAQAPQRRPRRWSVDRTR